MVPLPLTSIEFTCLHCGFRLRVGADKAGSRGECPGCGAALTIPQPIGGRLTGKRLQRAPDDSAPQLSSAPPPRAGGPRRDLIPADVEPGQGVGIDVTYQVNALCGRDQLPLVEESAAAICDALRSHMQSAPEAFDSAVLILDVQRFDCNDERLDAHARLVGWLNGEEYVQSASVWIDQQPARGLLAILLISAVRASLNALLPKAGYKSLRKLMSRQLMAALDDAAGRPVGWWTRFWRLAHTEV